MKEQTAVEWLINELSMNVDFPYGVPKRVIQQAKEIEKEQIIESYKAGVWDLGCKSADSEEYYNRTFKQQEQ